MILEMLFDIPIEIIIKDYVLSDFFLNKDKYNENLYDYSTEIPIKFINMFNEKYKSAFKYLLLVGLSQEDIYNIISKMEV